MSGAEEQNILALDLSNFCAMGRKRCITISSSFLKQNQPSPTSFKASAQYNVVFVAFADSEAPKFADSQETSELQHPLSSLLRTSLLGLLNLD
jgi:hypothetical protein